MRTISTITILLFIQGAIAQTTISGKVTDARDEAVPFANVYIKGSYDGTSTDIEGNYSFETYETGEQILVVSFMGYEDYEETLTLEGGSMAVNPQLGASAAELEPVVISAGAFEASDEKKAVILRPLDIVTTAGANGDIYGALQTLPGTQTVGEEQGLFVRGGTAGETATIIDEMYVRDPFFSSVPNVPQRGRFSPFLFKGTMFSTGGYSALYGQALSSVLVLNTQDMPTDSYTGIGIMPIGGSLSHTQAWDKTAFSVEGSYTHLGFYFDVMPQLTDWDEPPQGYDGSFMFRQKTSETGMFKLYTTYSKNQLSLYTPDLDNPETKYKFALSNQNTYINSSWKEVIGDHWSVFIGSSFAMNNDELQLDSIDLVEDDKLAQGKVIFTRTMGENSILRFGGEVHDQTVDGTYDTLPYDINDLYAATFAEADIFLTYKLAARVGVRAEHSEILDQYNLAPRTSLSYKTGENSQVSLAFGQFYQNPEDQLLYRPAGLGYEKATHYIANYQWMSDKRTFRIEFYDKEYDQLVKNTMNEPYQNNGGNGYARGVDIFWRDKQTIKNSDYWISYSYLDTKRDYRDYPFSAMPTYASKHTVSVVYKYWIAKITTSVSATYTYGSGRPYYNPTKAIEEFHSDRTPAYQNLNFSGSYLTQLWGNFTVIFFSVNNVLNHENVFGYNFNSSGEATPVRPPSLRTFFVGVFVSIGT